MTCSASSVAYEADGGELAFDDDGQFLNAEFPYGWALRARTLIERF